MVKTRSEATAKPASAPRGKEAQAAHARKLVAIQVVIALSRKFSFSCVPLKTTFALELSVN